MIDLLLGYLAVASLLAFAGGATWLMNVEAGEKRTCARLLFLAPVWPALVVPAIRTLWADTEWGKGGR